MKAAIYARKSNEQNVADDAKSVTRQIELSRAFAERNGWTVADEHIYQDDGVSGGEFQERDGLNRLLAVCGVTFSKADRRAKARPPFDVLIAMDESRLGREQIETSYLVKKITERGVRLFSYKTGAERTIGNATDKVILGLTNFAFEMEREQAVLRGKESRSSKFQKGHATGGAALGYRIVEESAGVKRFEKDPDQAKLVVRIFELAASNGYSTVANALNDELIVNPSPASADGKWTASGIREILQRELYRGVAVDGKSRWVYEDGTARKVRTPRSEWKRREAPELRILTEEAWTAAHARLAQTRAAYIRNNQGQLQAKPETGTDAAKHLLSGFLRCGSCGAKLQAVQRKNRRGVPSVTFACYNHRQAKARCANSHGLPAELIQETVVWRLTHDILTPALLDRCLADLATRAAGAPERIAEQRLAIDSRLAKLDAEVKRLVALAASGAAADTFLAGITEREAERRDLRAKLERLDGQDKAISQDAETVEALQGAILCWQSYMGQDSPQPGRAVLRKLGIERIVVNHQDDPEWPWSFTVRGSFENAITGRVYQAQETQAQLDEAEAWFAERVAEEDGGEDGAADGCSHNPAVALPGPRSFDGRSGRGLTSQRTCVVGFGYPQKTRVRGGRPRSPLPFARALGRQLSMSSTQERVMAARSVSG